MHMDDHDIDDYDTVLVLWILGPAIYGANEAAANQPHPFVATCNLTQSKTLGWREYCGGENWIHDKPECINASKKENKKLDTPALWTSSQGSKCKSKGQSPIQIDFVRTSFKPFNPIYFIGYEEAFHFEVENGAHAVYITPCNAPLEVYGGPLPVRYTLSRGVFHFGNDTTEHGSEHTIDHQNYAAELQLLMSSEKPTPTGCPDRGDGVAMLVTLFKKRAQSNPLLDAFINATRHMTFRGNTSEMAMPMANFLPNTTLEYYAYQGSLTFPPCTSNILVVVFSNPVDIGEQQLIKLRNNLYTMIKDCKYTIAGNLRNLQPLDNRLVYRSFKFSSPATRTLPSQLATLIAAAGAVIVIASW
ncbi:carbonic anhydrase 1-like [Haemaphysalis longicornis]